MPIIRKIKINPKGKNKDNKNANLDITFCDFNIDIYLFMKFIL